MKFEFTAEQTKKVIEHYYRKYEDFNGELSMQCNMGETFISFVKDYVPVTDFKLYGDLVIDNISYPVSVPVSESNVCCAFKTVLEDQGYSVKKVKVNCSGDERTKQAQFNSVIVDMATKRKVK